MKDFHIQKNKGFTMIETLVAIFVLLIATTGPLAFTQSGLRSSFLARDQVVAFYLAQESVESIKNIRDNNFLLNRDWLTGLENCLDSGGGEYGTCNIGLTSSDDTEVSSCSGSVCGPLRYIGNKFLQETNGEISKYTRTVYVSKITEEEIQVIVEVAWSTASFAPRRIVIQENIFNKY